MKLPKISIIFLFFIAPTIAFSQEKINKEPLSVTYVLNKYIKALGGQEALNKIENRIQKNSMVTSMDISGKKTVTESTMIQAITKDGKIVSLMGSNGDFATKVFYDGVKGYTYLKALNKKMPFDKATTKMYKNTIRLFPETKNTSTYSSDVKIEDYNNQKCYVLLNRLGSGATAYDMKEYYSVENGLLIGSSFKNASSESQTYVTDYRNINGVLTSLQQTSKTIISGGSTVLSSIKVEEITYNGMIDSYFTENNDYAAKQLASIPFSKSKHEEGFKNIGAVVSSSSESYSQSNNANTSTETSSAFTPTTSSNKRDITLNEILKNKRETSNVSNAKTTVSTTGKRTDVEDLEDEYKDFTDLKYRRSSLYTLMVNDPNRERNEIIRNAFGNSELSPKFNNHNIGPYLIDGVGGEKDQIELIESYLNKNNVARELVAKWFNRQPDGSFNMDLIAERGQYNASDLNQQLAESSIRGKSLLKDAGIELLENTYVIVYDYKYTNKEETAKKRKGFLNVVSSVASFIPGAEDVISVAETAKLAADVVGKGYYVRTTTYLYKLVWDDETANTFYNKYWVDAKKSDSKKRDEFDKSTLFKLKYVGSEISRNNLQSTIFTKKSNDELIEIATVRAIDKNISKLQRTFEEFRVKTPLLSGNPISAKIGTKEGIEKGDKFEVLEQIIDEDGITSYERVGVIKVDKNSIWDNLYLSEQVEDDQKNDTTTKKDTGKKKLILAELYGAGTGEKKKKKNIFKKDNKKQENKLEYTIFKGSEGKFASGMLIRQIN